MTFNTTHGIMLSIAAAALYAISTPFSKLLLNYMAPTLMAGFLYVGAGLGMFFLGLIRKTTKTGAGERRLTKTELPYTIAMILLDIAAPVFLLIGLQSANAANVSLLNNFEIVATAVIAMLIFKENITLRLWLGILFITVSCMLLSFEDICSLQFSYGNLFVLLAAFCWGLENNCTRKISAKDPLQIVLLKGIFSGCGSIIIGSYIGEKITAIWCIPLVLLLGFISYGLSIYYYVYGQRILGAAKTSAYYAVSPFIGALLSLIIFRTDPGIHFAAALLVMLIGAWLSSC